MQIKESEVGVDYMNAIEEVLKIRKERFKVYGDSFLEDGIEDLLVYVKGKINRYKYQKKLGTENNSYEKSKDCLIDLVNYALFILAKELKNEK